MRVREQQPHTLLSDHSPPDPPYALTLALRGNAKFRPVLREQAFPKRIFGSTNHNEVTHGTRRICILVRLKGVGGK